MQSQQWPGARSFVVSMQRGGCNPNVRHLSNKSTLLVTCDGAVCSVCTINTPEFWFTDGGRKSSRELELEPGTETIVSTLAVGPL
jgi:hypothetical protein